MLEFLLASLGLVLIIEGVLYFFLANNLKKFLNYLSLINPLKIKNIAALCAITGLCLIYFTFKYYDI